MKILSANYQRNGVSGNPFFSLVTNGIDGGKGKFLITFETTQEDGEKEDTNIDIPSCRVVCINDDTQSWRGDRVAEDIQRVFNQSNHDTYYDFMKSIRDTKTK